VGLNKSVRNDLLKKLPVSKMSVRTVSARGEADYISIRDAICDGERRPQCIHVFPGTYVEDFRMCENLHIIAYPGVQIMGTVGASDVHGCSLTNITMKKLKSNHSTISLDRCTIAAIENTGNVNLSLTQCTVGDKEQRGSYSMRSSGKNELSLVNTIIHGRVNVSGKSEFRYCSVDGSLSVGEDSRCTFSHGELRPYDESATYDIGPRSTLSLSFSLIECPSELFTHPPRCVTMSFCVPL